MAGVCYKIISLDERCFTFFYERRDLICIRIPNSQYILYDKLLYL